MGSDEPVVGNSRFAGSRRGYASWNAFWPQNPGGGAPQGGSRQGAGKKTELAARVAAEGHFPMKTVADVLGVARSHLHERVHRPAPPRGRYCKAADEELLPLIRRVVDQCPTYSCRRVTALANRVLAAEDKPAANHKAHLPNHEAARLPTPTLHWPPQGLPA
jgi:hypothetical protein